MLYNKQEIDFEIIWKKVHNTISEEEEKLFREWINIDKTHQKYYKDVVRFYSEGSVFEDNPADTHKAWTCIKKNIQNNSKRNVRKIILYASSVAAGILVIFSLIFLHPGIINYNYGDITEHSIEPGENKAVLVLDDGSVFDLSANKELSIVHDGTKINNQGTSLHYDIKAKKRNNAKLKYNTLRVPRGGEYFLMLSDSTKVWLNSETTLRYPIQFSGNKREVELIGEAYFEVKKNQDKPFIVASGEQIVEVLGTSFNISSYEEDSLIFTTLVNGKVEVYLKDNPEMKQTLLPDSQSYLFKGEGQLSQRKVDPEQFVAWKEGRFVFERKPLSQMMNTLSKWYDLQVVFENERAKEIKFTGELKRYDSFEKILAIMEKTQEINIETQGHLIIIK